VRWKNGTWTLIAALDPGSAACFAAFDPGLGSELFVGGNFGYVQGVQSSNIASYSPRCEFATYCLGDGTWGHCPCTNDSTTFERAGCFNSTSLGGALRAHGCASVASDALILQGSGMPDGAVLYFQGEFPLAWGLGTPFSDGALCIDVNLTRLAVAFNAGGASAVPNATSPQALSQSGGLPAWGGVRQYQAWYRDSAAFCTAATSNLTNAVEVVWNP
jgi:hypothetical protein